MATSPPPHASPTPSTVPTTAVAPAAGGAGLPGAAGELVRRVERFAQSFAGLATWLSRAAAGLVLLCAGSGVVTWLIWWWALHGRTWWGVVAAVVVALLCAVPALIAWSVRRRATASRLASLRLHHDLRDFAASNALADVESLLRTLPASLQTGLHGGVRANLAALRSLEAAAAGLRGEAAPIRSAASLARTLALVPARVMLVLGSLGLLAAAAVVGLFVAVLT